MKPGMKEMKAGRMLPVSMYTSPPPASPPPPPRTHTPMPTTPDPIYTCSMGPIRSGHPCPRPGRWPSPSWGPRAGRSAGAGQEARIEGAGRGGRLRPRGCPCVPGPKPQDSDCARGRPERSEASSAAPLGAAQTPPSARGRQPRSYPALPGPGAHPAPAPQQGTRICTGIWFKFSKRTALVIAERPGTSKRVALLRSQVGA